MPGRIARVLLAASLGWWSRSRTVAAPGEFERPLPFAAAEEAITPVADAVSLPAILSRSLLSDEVETRRPDGFLLSAGRVVEEDEGAEAAVADARLARLLVLGCALNVEAECECEG